ncbi:GDSL-type esterase/lipase family protein [Haloferula sp.]|uniref:GDSL-type esterase/lipase family protein n=1 Tax=Haloferula sp. TaxID=2497595 RepID=UPI00329E13D2
MIRPLIATILLALPLGAKEDPDPARFAKDIDRFDTQDEKSSPEKGGIVFSGSSSIRLLDIPEVFPGLTALNRGFGGSEISDLNHYLERCLLRYEPSLVIFFCGTNDLWKKKSPDQVVEDFDEYTRRLFERCPDAKLVVLAIRPSPARKSIRKTEAEMNERFRKIAETDKRITFVPGSWDRFLKNGKCIPELFAKDRLHMSPAGYAIWKELLTPFLPTPSKAD